MKQREVCLSERHVEALEQMAQENHATPDELVALAVEALIAEAARHSGWIPQVRVDRSVPPSPTQK